MNALTIKDEIVFDLQELKKGETLDVSGNKIITVISGKIQERLKGILGTFESSVYHAGKIEAVEGSFLSIFDIKDLDIILNKLDIILNKIDVEERFGEYCRANWTKLSNLPGCENLDYVDLYRGDQIEKTYDGVRYKFNLWFCGPNVDYLFYNQHNFEEIHTNIAGDGFMQKSLGITDEKLLETVGLMPGVSHKTFYIKGEYEENGNPKYPMHRWLGGKTGNIWLVIEKYDY